MIEIILDVSANTFKNNINYFENMVSKISEIDSSKYKIVFKTQLFNKDSEVSKVNTVLNLNTFRDMFAVCTAYGYELTTSVFDKESLAIALQHEITFIKIACRESLYKLALEVPKDIPVYISVDARKKYPKIIYDFIVSKQNVKLLQCIPEYPAKEIDYMYSVFEKEAVYPKFCSISDHTTNLNLFRYWRHNLKDLEDAGTFLPYDGSFEMHYVLEHDKNNPDAGAFAKTPDDLREIL